MATISKIGFCKCRLLENGDINNINDETISDIQNNYGVQFKFDYSWNGTTCTINNIGWKTVEIQVDPETGNRSIQAVSLSSDKYKKTGPSYLQISFKGSNLPLDDDVSISNKTYPSDVVKNNITTKYITASFKYSYTENYIEYYIEIPDIKIQKASKYEHNVIFTEAGLNELLGNIKSYPIINIESIKATEKENDDFIWTKYAKGKPCIRIDYGDETKSFTYDDDNTLQTIGYKYVAVGSNITFPNGSTIDNPESTDQSSGTIRITMDGVTHEIPVYGLSGTGTNGVNLSGTTTVAGHLLPSKDATPTPSEWNIGASDKKWHTVYALNGNFTNLTSTEGTITNLTSATGTITNLTSTTGTITNLTATTATITNLNLPAGTGDTAFNLKGGTTAQFLRGNGSNKNPTWSNELTGSITVGAYLAMKGYSGYTPANQAGFWYDGTNKRIKTYNISASANDIDFESYRVFNAVFNDYAECRSTINLAPGHVVIDQDDGSLACSTTRLQPGAQVISDTYGHLMGETDTAKTPIAVAGRVLVYTYQPRENYHAGMAVCSAPDGTVDIMTREEIRDYPDCIVGIVSEIPQYETWGSDNVKVDGRIWIKVK